MRQAGVTSTALVALIGWTLFAFAGAYRWTVVPVVLLAAAMVIGVRPRTLTPQARLLDAALLASAAAISLQLVPVPSSFRHAFSPTADAVDRALRVGSASSPVGPVGPLTLDPASTAWALATALALLAVFWTARTAFERRGLREVSRGVAWMGLALAAIVFVQRFASPRHIYGFWALITQTPDPRPLGPFVNRNDLATWLVLAIPMVIGYSAARTVPQLRGERPLAGLVRAFDARATTLAFAVLLMTAALVASLSRSGLTGLAAALTTLAVLGRAHLGRTGSRAFALALLAVLAMALPFANVAALGGRWGDALPADMGSRVAIWQDSWAMARDFFTTGVGVGAFERAMLVYQRGSRLMFFNHAHNEYLQVLAEGGLLVIVPAAVAVLAGIVAAARALRRDSGAVFWFRAGTVSGLVGVAIQSVWDTGLRMPANGMLFTVAVAMALHRSSGGDHHAIGTGHVREPLRSRPSAPTSSSISDVHRPGSHRTG
ncbi:MAG: O-antigen ligase family protein [Acidimicrobiia bacterium]|nr:O-antigen ligase family protein [Acidimicrobiia bacterium]